MGGYNGFKLNTNNVYKLSEDSLNELIKDLDKYIDKLLDSTEKAMKRATEEATKDNLKSTVAMDVVRNGNVISGGIKTTDYIDTFREFGTGLVGKNNPHVNDYLKTVGWIYDVNQYGKKGWWYPTDESDPNPYKKVFEDGQLRGWTIGQKAQKKFYLASKKMQENFKKYLKEEMEG